MGKKYKYNQLAMIVPAPGAYEPKAKAIQTQRPAFSIGKQSKRCVILPSKKNQNPSPGDYRPTTQ